MTKYDGVRETVKNGVATTISDRSSLLVQQVFTTGVANSVKLDPSDSYKELEDTDCNGDKVTVFKYIEKKATNVSFDFPSSTVELKLAAMAKRMTQKSTVLVPFGLSNFNVPDVASPSLAASAVGIYGEGVVADAAAIGSVLIGGVSQALEQQSFAGFSASAPFSFAIGANGAVKFSDDCRGRLASIGGAFHTLSDVWDSTGASITVLGLQHRFIDHNRQVSILDIPSISLERSGIDIGNPQQSFKGLVNGDFTVYTLNKLNRC